MQTILKGLLGQVMALENEANSRRTPSTEHIWKALRLIAGELDATRRKDGE